MPLERIISHFQTESETIASLARGKIIYANDSDKGTSREDILLDFIDRHLPNRFKIIKGGLIFDSRGNESNQIDLIITNDLTLQFSEFAGHRFGKSFNCLEGCIAVISVKSRLDKDGIIDSLKKYKFNPIARRRFYSKSTCRKSS
jgi:hypothetical protein